MEWGSAPWWARPARISWLARPTGLAGSASLAWSPRMGWQAVLVRAPVGGAALLRNHHCRRGTRNACHRGRNRCGSASPPSRLVLVLGGSIRVSRILGLLLSRLCKARPAGCDRLPPQHGASNRHLGAGIQQLRRSAAAEPNRLRGEADVANRLAQAVRLRFFAS